MLADSAHERKRPGASGPVDLCALSAAITPILEGLERSKWHGAELTFRCPAPDHEDRNPSASWKPDDGVWCCHKGTCGAHGGALDLARLLGLDVDRYRTAGALPEPRNGSGPTNGAPKAERLPAAPARASEGKRPQTLEALRRRNGCTVYEYQDAEGQGVGLSIRVDQADGGKRFELWHAAAGGWLPGRIDGEYPLYRLPAILTSSGAVYLAEGEQCADALAARGLTGTTCIMGAGKAKETDLSTLMGRPVVILPDNDEAGAAHAQDVATKLQRIAASVRVLAPFAPPATFTGKGYDVADYLEGGGTAADLEELAKAAPEWTPPPTDVGQAPEPEPAAAPASKKPGAAAGPPIVCAADVEARRASWLWRPYIPRGVITFLTGEPSAGKSWLAVTLAAAVSNGRGLPFGLATEPGRVLYLTAEDDLHVTIRPRLEEAGADLARVYLAGEAVTLTDPAGLAWLLEAVDTFRPDLVVIDTLSAFFGGKADFHKANEARTFSAPLAALAAKSGAAVLVLRHGSKAAGRKVGHIGQGSVDFTAAARSELLAGVDPNDDSRRAMVHTKANMGPKGSSIGYQIEALEDDPDRSRFTWTGETNLTAGDLMACDYQASEDDDTMSRTDAETLILNLINDSEDRQVTDQAIKAAWAEMDGTLTMLRKAKVALRKTAGLRNRPKGNTDGGRGASEHVFYIDHEAKRAASPDPFDSLASIRRGQVNSEYQEPRQDKGSLDSLFTRPLNMQASEWAGEQVNAEPALALLPGEF